MNSGPDPCYNVINMYRRLAKFGLTLSCLLCTTACLKPWTPPPCQSPVPRPTIMVHTPHGWQPMSADDAKAYVCPEPTTQPAALSAYIPFDSDLPPFADDPSMTCLGEPFRQIPALHALSGPADISTRLYSVSPQYYYVRGEHTSTGYIPAQYGRIDNYTPGQHTSEVHIPGHYRADGLYTRPEHTSTGYIPGHYRAELLPFGQPVGQVQMAPAATIPMTFNRPLGAR